MNRRATNQNTFYIICHNIRSLYNVGSIFRTADAFSVTKIFLTGYTGTPKNPRLSKTSLGAEKTVGWEYRKNLKKVLDKLKKEKFQIIALENNVPNSMSLNKFKPKFPMALLLGEEVAGTKSRDRCTGCCTNRRIYVTTMVVRYTSAPLKVRYAAS